MKTKVAIKKQYIITLWAVPAKHQIFYDTLVHALKGFHVPPVRGASKEAKPTIEVKTI